MKRKILILEVFTSTNRREFWINAKAKFQVNFEFSIIDTQNELKAFIDSISTIPENLFVIFAHSSDVEKIEKRGKLINECNKKNIPLVLYSGGGNNGYKLDELLLEDLYVSVLVENLDYFLNDAKELTSISTDDLGKLAAIDPKFEELLTPFASINPLANNDLKDAKAKLQERVNVLLKK